MKLPVWPEEDQEDMPGPSTDYNLTQEFSSTSSDNEVKNEKNTDM